GRDGADPGDLAHMEDRDAPGADDRGDLAAVDGVLSVVPPVSVQNLSGLRQALDVLGCGEPISRGSAGACLESLEKRERGSKAGELSRDCVLSGPGRTVEDDAGRAHSPPPLSTSR